MLCNTLPPLISELWRESQVRASLHHHTARVSSAEHQKEKTHPTLDKNLHYTDQELMQAMTVNEDRF